MPKRFYPVGHMVFYGDGNSEDRCFCEAVGPVYDQETEARAKRIADALNAADNGLGCDLLPCAFCGCRDVEVVVSDEAHYASCTNCGAGGPTAATDEAAGSRWNLRIFPDGVARPYRSADRDRPWVGAGPTPEEAGGESILVRIGEDLVRAVWSRPPIGEWCPDISIRLREDPTGWRPMPKP